MTDGRELPHVGGMFLPNGSSAGNLQNSSPTHHMYSTFGQDFKCADGADHIIRFALMGTGLIYYEKK